MKAKWRILHHLCWDKKFCSSTYYTPITSPTAQASQSRLPLISARHGQTDLVILHSFCVLIIVSRYLKHMNSYIAWVCIRQLCCLKKTFLNYSRLTLEGKLIRTWMVDTYHKLSPTTYSFAIQFGTTVFRIYIKYLRESPDPLWCWKTLTLSASFPHFLNFPQSSDCLQDVK